MDLVSHHTTRENDQIQKDHSFIDGLNSMLRAVIREIPGAKDRYYQEKPKVGEYGYFMSYNPGLRTLMERLKKKSFLDLGSGPGLIMAPMRRFDSYNAGITCVGYENDDLFVQIGQNLGIDIKLKDILELTERDIHQYDVIHTWNPFTRIPKRKEFIKNLAEIVRTGQIVLDFSGSHWDMFNIYPQFKKLENKIFQGTVYQVIK